MIHKSIKGRLFNSYVTHIYNDFFLKLFISDAVIPKLFFDKDLLILYYICITSNHIKTH